MWHLLLAWAALDAAVIVALWGEPRPVSEAEAAEFYAAMRERRSR